MSEGRRKPASRNKTRYYRKKGQVRPVSPFGGAAGGFLSGPTSNGMQ
jgi:hypothetical protein